MHFALTSVRDVVLITPERIPDERGFFSLTWSEQDFTAQGLNARMVVRNGAYNREAGTLRGMHLQRAPYAETKLVSATTGAIYDVAVDLRTDSPSYGRWVGAELRADSGAMLYIPEGCAHGYITLQPETTVEYLISQVYAPAVAVGVRWNDPFFGIQWPLQPRVISDRDRAWPDYAGTPPA